MPGSLEWLEIRFRSIGSIELAMHVEEICLSAAVDDFEAEQPPQEQKQSAAIAQTNRMRFCRSEFTLFNNHRLAVKTQGFMQQARSYTIDIGILDPQPKRVFKIGWIFLLIFLVLCGAAGFLDSLSILLGLGAGLCLILAVYRSHDRLVFYSQYGRVPLVVLFNRSPDRVTLVAFTDALVQQIKDAKTQYPGANESLSEELKAHRRLMQEGGISNKRYDIVKQRILSQHSVRGQ